MAENNATQTTGAHKEQTAIIVDFEAPDSQSKEQTGKPPTTRRKRVLVISAVIVAAITGERRRLRSRMEFANEVARSYSAVRPAVNARMSQRWAERIIRGFSLSPRSPRHQEMQRDWDGAAPALIFCNNPRRSCINPLNSFRIGYPGT